MANMWRTRSGLFFFFVSISSCKKYCECKCAANVCKIIIIYINNWHNSLPYPSSLPSLLHSLSSPAVTLSFFLSRCIYSLWPSIHPVLPRNLFPFPPSSSLVPSLSPPAGSSRLAQSDAMVVIGCPLPQIRSQLALGVLCRLPITLHPKDQGLTPERVEDRQERKG